MIKLSLNNEIIDELNNLIHIPTVLMDKNGGPIEYKDAFERRKIKARKVENISPNIVIFTLQNNGDLSSLQQFSSGNFVSYLMRNGVYKYNSI